MICVSRDIKYEVFYPKKYERKNIFFDFGGEDRY